MNERSIAPDAIVIGGGVIGLSIAWELAQHGVSVRVLEQGMFGQEASWAGAGMLPPGNPEQARSIEARLRAGSHVLWPDWAERLRNQSGIDNEFHRCGGIEIRLGESGDDLQSEIAAWRAEGVSVEPLNKLSLQKYIPAINPDATTGYLLPDLGQVRNPRHLKALYLACSASGVDLRSGTPVFDFVRQGERITSIRTVDGEHSAAEFIVASGAWSRSLVQRAGHDLEIEPIRGQIVLLESRPMLFRHVIQMGARYLVPRRDGRILIGSTEEHAGFEKRNTAEAVAGLIEFGQLLVPELRNARFENCWAGLRPCAPSRLPSIGLLPGTRNLNIAAGHFRAGLQLSPITAVLIREMILKQSQAIWATELAPNSTVLFEHYSKAL